MTRRELLWLAWAAIPPALLFLFPFLLGRTHFAGDVTYSFQPWLSYAAQEIQAGRFPLWNPYTASGEALLANPQLMVFYPPAALFWTLPFSAAWRLFLAFHQFLLFFSMALLIRIFLRAGRLALFLGATSLTWGGFAVVHWEFPAATATLAQSVLFVAACAGPAALTLPAAALLLFAGYTQLAYYAVAMGAGLVVRRAFMDAKKPMEALTRCATWAAALGGGCALAAVFLLPPLETAGLSLRGGITAADVHAHALTPALLWKFIFPDLIDKVALAFRPGAFDPAAWPIQRNWLTTFYMGVGPLLLALTGIAGLGRRNWGWAAGLLAAAAVLVFGLEPFFSWTRALVPGWKYLTHFSNAMAVVLLFFALNAARAGENLDRRRGVLAGMSLMVAVLGAAVAGSAGLRAYLAGGLVGASDLTAAQEAWMSRAGWTAVAAAAAFGLSLFLPRRARAWTLAGVVLIDLWFFGRDLHPLAEADFFQTRSPLAQEGSGRVALSPGTMRSGKPMGGRDLAESYRIVRAHFYPNTHLPYRVFAAWGYEVFGHKPFAEFRRRIPDAPGESAALDFLAVNRLVSLEALPAPNKLLAQSPIAWLYERPGALERLSVAPTARVIVDGEERLKFLSEGWDPRREVVLEEGEVFSGAPRLVGWREAPGRVAARGAGAGWLVYSGVDYPGWEAYVNGAPSAIRRANHAFQAVALPDGEWSAQLLYRPKAFRTGLWISTAVLIFLLGWAVGRLSRHPATRARRTR